MQRTTSRTSSMTMKTASCRSRMIRTMSQRSDATATTQWSFQSCPSSVATCSRCVLPIPISLPRRRCGRMCPSRAPPPGSQPTKDDPLTAEGTSSSGVCMLRQRISRSFKFNVQRLQLNKRLKTKACTSVADN